jgi:hypothetical protein
MVLTSISLNSESSHIVACKDLENGAVKYYDKPKNDASKRLKNWDDVEDDSGSNAKMMHSHLMNADDRAYEVSALGWRQCIPDAMLGQPRKDRPSLPLPTSSTTTTFAWGGTILRAP